eukprot:m.192520 g.192520  ORF g.192520 m.192520 type:complete len:61 (-) comp15657_c0_seq3:3875-4057(-)
MGVPVDTSKKDRTYLNKNKKIKYPSTRSAYNYYLVLAILAFLFLLRRIKKSPGFPEVDEQ